MSFASRRDAARSKIARRLIPSLLSLCCASALAQTAQEAEPAASDAKDKVVTTDAVKVSASRIDRPGFQAPTPTMQISNEELSIASRPNVAAALNDLPQFRATQSPQTTSTNTGSGSAPVDLRGLGISRTLVLIDGRRFSSENDLNTIPSILVKNVDVVTGGASAAWGSGAVGGVVNIAIDEDFTGARFDVHAGQSSRSDNDEHRFEAAFGGEFGGSGHAVLGLDYFHSEGIIPRVARDNAGRWATFANGDGTVTTAANVGASNLVYGGIVTTGVMAGKGFNPDGTLRDVGFDRVVGTTAIGDEARSSDDLSPLMTPQKRYAALGRATWDFSDTLKLTAEVRHSKMWNDYIWFGDHNRGNLTIGIDNAYLDPQARAAMAAAGQTSFRMGRFNSDLSYSSIDFQRKTTQATLALDGRFGNDWRWSAYYSHGEFEEDFRTPGFLLTREYANAVDSVISPTTGQPVCRVALTDAASNCVPIDLFGLGAPSQAAIDYVTGTPSSHARTKLDVGGASLRGEPFALPAGPVSVAVGLEARREGIRRTVGDLDAAGAFTSFSFSPMAGSFTVREAFGEVLVPVLKDKPVFNDLAVNAAARVSDYSTTGDIWSWKIGFTNEFLPGLRARFNRSRDIRSANLTELYTTTTTGYNTVNDPFTNRSIYVLTNGGGNPAVTPETAYTTTYGFSWAPQAVEGLDMSLDYFDIAIDNVITTVAAQDILTRCYNGNQAMCGRIERDADGNLSRIVSTYVNLSRYESDGIDAEVAYALPLSRVSDLPGMLRLRLLGTWVHSLTTNDGVSEIEYVTSQGYSFGLGTPRWRANASVAYQNANWGANLRARYVSSGVYNRTINITNNAIPSYLYYDLGLTFNVPTGNGPSLQLYANVNNLTDKDPPPGSIFSPYYDVVGRYYTVGARIDF
jgi:iron complex outermembrane recepter protein